MRAWNELSDLRERNARHRKGWRCQDATPDDAIRDMRSEMEELAAESDDITELADLFIVGIHLAMIRGWTLDELDTAMCDKLNTRFTA